MVAGCRLVLVELGRDVRCSIILKKQTEERESERLGIRDHPGGKGATY